MAAKLGSVAGDRDAPSRLEAAMTISTTGPASGLRLIESKTVPATRRVRAPASWPDAIAAVNRRSRGIRTDFMLPAYLWAGSVLVKAAPGRGEGLVVGAAE